MENNEITIPFWFVEQQKNGKQTFIAGKNDRHFWRGEHFDAWDCKEYGYRTEAAAKRAIERERKWFEKNFPENGYTYQTMKFTITFSIEDAKYLRLI